MLPRVIIFNAVSADGRIDWFTADQEAFYGIAMKMRTEAILAGSNTIVKMETEIPEEKNELFEKPRSNSGDERPLLVIADSKGRIKKWNEIRKFPYWRDVLVLCSNTTPKTYLNYLKLKRVDYMILGEDRVDLKVALEILNSKYGVTAIRVESGGVLNGTLLRENLVHEVHLLVHPAFVGGITPQSVFRAPDLSSSEGVVKLKLIHARKMKSDIVWLRYDVKKRK